MKYCIECGSEYQDSATECSDCPGSQLVDADGMRQRGLPLPHERDTREFIRVGTAEDPLTAEQFVRMLEAENIPVFSRPRRAGTVDVLTTGNPMPWWEILVPEEHTQRAAELLAREKARLEATSDEASRAAEEEELETEAASAPPGVS
ncbi:putative signal transducing protein [Hyalangium rubrum]|uniref:DUF2007 domain-containing protein n=1 Tax=Hyalangium rubrum TaxID=3103134 RepID=A0ABU5HCG2_9BACT|nr:DUF2007 domain-containing protein [Hyalangium sp. s54d21]MDY7230517.1 DUF2007 domain-containing protein [Hyalangium sp. s54d21]